MPLEAILFDLDGTLVDTAPDFISTLKQLAMEYQLEPADPELVYQTVSNGARALTKLQFGIEESAPGFDERNQRLLDLYQENLGKYCQLYPGIQSLLDTLQQHQLPWGIVTNKPVRFAKPLIETLAFSYPPGTLICPDHVTAAKPSPEPLLLACKELGCSAENSVYIGDHKRDIRCGLDAGSQTIAVSFGYTTDDEDITGWQAHAIAAQAHDIWDLANKLLPLE